jgi:hypothetical protein
LVQARKNLAATAKREAKEWVVGEDGVLAPTYEKRRAIGANPGAPGDYFHSESEMRTKAYKEALKKAKK